MQRPERRGLGEHPRPNRRLEFGARTLERERIGAVGTAERATVRQLDQDADRRRRGGGE